VGHAQREKRGGEGKETLNERNGSNTATRLRGGGEEAAIKGLVIQISKRAYAYGVSRGIKEMSGGGNWGPQSLSISAGGKWGKTKTQSQPYCWGFSRSELKGRGGEKSRATGEKDGSLALKEAGCSGDHQHL